MIEIKGQKPAVGGVFGVGLLVTLLAVATLVYQRLPTFGAAAFLALGLVLVSVAVHALITQKFQLRATEQGISFAGSRVIPWSEVSQIMVGRWKSRFDPVANVPALVSIDFRDRRTLFRLPLTFWISSPFSMGTSTSRSTE